MIDVLFFASIREQLGTSGLSFSLEDERATIASFRQRLIALHGGSWSEVLCADNVVIAVNQQVVNDQHLLTDGDELAFFPPVTGG